MSQTRKRYFGFRCGYRSFHSIQKMIKISGFFLMIHGIAASLFVGFPATDWETSATVCTLATRSDVDKVGNNNHNITKFLEKQMSEAAWLGERVIYSRWTAYRGCSTSFSTNTEMITESFDDCVSYCSDFPGAYFAFQNDKCSCLQAEPVINNKSNGCRQNCQNFSEFACGTGRSAMVFEYVKVANLKENETFTDRECIARHKIEKSNHIENCNISFGYICRHESTEIQKKTWYEYQKECIDKGQFILYGQNLQYTANNDFYWTPVFRTHLIMKGLSAKNEDCKSIAVNAKMEYVVKNCSSKLPFLCSTSRDRDQDTNNGNDKALPSFITLPISVVISVSTVVVILLIVVVIMCIKQRQMKSRLEEFPPTFETTRRDNYPPPSKSPSANKIRLRDTYAETCDTPRRPGGYHDVYDDVNKGFILKR